MKIITHVSLLVLLTVTACTKGPDTPDVPPVDTSTHQPLDTPVNRQNDNIYFVGDTVEPKNYDRIAVYWKNDTMHLLPNTIESSGKSIAFDGDDVYIGCSFQYPGDYIGYWKNGSGVNVTSDQFGLFDNVQVAVSNGNLYVAGSTTSLTNGLITPAYRKNNEPFVLMPHVYTLDENYITSLAVQDSDVYIGGSSTLPPPSLYTTYGATYWKNSVPVYLSNNDTILSSSSVNAITISNSDVYAAGITTWSNYSVDEESHALYWKNGKPQYLTTGKNYSIANAIAVSGNDVYVGGAVIGKDYFPRAAYWKNGQLVKLDPAELSEVKAIAVQGNNVYAAGYERGFRDSAVYWKNGVRYCLQTGHIYAIGINK